MRAIRLAACLLLAAGAWAADDPKLPPAPKEVAASALRADLPLLRAVMEKGYAGWASAERRGWDWSRFFADWDRGLAAKGDAKLSVTEALEPFARLEAAQVDNQTGPVGVPFFHSGSRAAVLDAAPAGTCTEMRTVAGVTTPLDAKDAAQAPRKARILSDPNSPEHAGTYLAYPARLGILAAIDCGGKWIGAQPTWAHSRRLLIASLAGKSPDQPSYRALSGGIAYLRLPTFTAANTALLHTLAGALPETAGHERVLVIDLRSNEGGDAAVDDLARWIDVAAARKAIAGIGRHAPQSCITDALRANRAPALEANCPLSAADTASAWGYREHRADGAATAGHPRLLVLVDNECTGGCETLAAMLAAAPGSAIAGENTFGLGQFPDAGYFTLPASRIPFSVAMTALDIYGDGRSFDGYGLDVDIVLPSEESQGAQAIVRLAGRMLQ